MTADTFHSQPASYIGLGGALSRLLVVILLHGVSIYAAGNYLLRTAITEIRHKPVEVVLLREPEPVVSPQPARQPETTAMPAPQPPPRIAKPPDTMNTPRHRFGDTASVKRKPVPPAVRSAPHVPASDAAPEPASKSPTPVSPEPTPQSAMPQFPASATATSPQGPARREETPSGASMTRSSAPLTTPATVDPDHCEKPAYPRGSRRNEEQGTVLLSLHVGSDGSVLEARVEQSSGFRALDRAARTALSQCRFRPATTNGQPEASWTKIQYIWKLEDRTF